MANAIGDLAFPDNVNRRKRAGELHDDIVTFGANFQKLLNERAQISARLRPKVKALLHKFHIATPSELEQRVNKSLNSDQMQEYRQLKSSLDKNDDFQNMLSSLIDVGAVASGVVIGALAIGGVITAGAAFAAAGDILAILAAVVVIVGLFEASEEREELRKAIRDLWPKRQQVRQALGQMNVIMDWLKTIEIWVENLEHASSKLVDVLVKKTVKQDYAEWTLEHTAQVLLELDQSRASWINEDPGHDIPDDVGSFLPKIDPFKSTGGVLDLIGHIF
ncbi:hypothetical protein G7Y79_00014g037580 [Physcia stellaris]|nr:hypothetical protein G7Y79_00014g037580 [Physcia stellaris]